MYRLQANQVKGRYIFWRSKKTKKKELHLIDKVEKIETGKYAGMLALIESETGWKAAARPKQTVEIGHKSQIDKRDPKDKSLRGGDKVIDELGNIFTIMTVEGHTAVMMDVTINVSAGEKFHLTKYHVSRLKRVIEEG